MPYNPSMFSFVETRLFTKLVVEYLTQRKAAINAAGIELFIT
jgi:hypothetical protein